jgi:uncharacterized membrane protein YuzA (DUF378 family)
MEIAMKFANGLTLLLVIVGGLNWGLVGFFGFDLVATIFGTGSLLARAVYVIVGASAAWQILPLLKSLGGDGSTLLRASTVR